jgi:hypothetical protein
MSGPPYLELDAFIVYSNVDFDLKGLSHEMDFAFEDMYDKF